MTNINWKANNSTNNKIVYSSPFYGGRIYQHEAIPFYQNLAHRARGVSQTNQKNNQSLESILKDLRNVKISKLKIKGLKPGKDRILLAPSKNDVIDKTQFRLNQDLYTNNQLVWVNGPIPKDTPRSGIIRVQSYNGDFFPIQYSGWVNDEVLNCSSYRFTGFTGCTGTRNTPNGANAFISYIDKIAEDSEESLSILYTGSPRKFVLYVRDTEGIKKPFGLPFSLDENLYTVSLEEREDDIFHYSSLLK